MFKNYFKLAIKVLNRRKFFTFISLFGISFTLMILMLISAFLDNELGSNAPMSEKDKMVFLSRGIMKKIVKDTVEIIDSSLMDGLMRYDTTYDYVDRTNSTSTSSLSYTFLDTYLREVDGAVYQSFFSHRNTFDVFVNSKKLTLGAIYCDAPYWQIFDFKFLEGKPFLPQQVANQEQVTIITEKAANQYFGRSTGVIGQFIVLEDKQFEVIGVVKKSNNSRSSVRADVYLPITNINPIALNDKNYLGRFEGVYLAAKPDHRERITADINRKVSLINLPNPEEYNHLEVSSSNFAERYAVGLLYNDDPKRSLRIIGMLVLGLLSLFILLPTLNLINVNVSRIMERSSEIGVRKAFGAHSGNILFQFVFENIILTFLGGIIGFVLALVLLNLINDSNLLRDITLGFNFRVFTYSILICLAFGIISGLIPAYRMSRLQIANALKQNQL